MNVFQALNEVQVAVLQLRTSLRRLPGDELNEVASVSLRHPLQVIEDATREIERWLEAHQKFCMQEGTITYPTTEAHDDRD